MKDLLTTMTMIEGTNKRKSVKTVAEIKALKMTMILINAFVVVMDEK